MASGYFDTPAVSGFTWRTYYEEKAGVITITDVKLQSKTYTGTWYPGGKITINGKTVLEMDYNNPATHAFNFSAAGDSFISWQVLTGESLPVSSERILTQQAEIAVEVMLYRNSSSAKPSLSGSFSINVENGLIYLDDGKTVSAYQICIDNGSSWDTFAPQIANGSSWDLYS